MIRLKEYRDQSQGLPDLLNYAALVDEGIMLNKDGSFLAGFYFAGMDLFSTADEELNAISNGINSALAKLGTGWMLHVDSRRFYANGYCETDQCFFPDPVTALIDEERRRAHRLEGAHYENRFTLYLNYLPPPEIKERLKFVFITGDEDHRPANTADKLLDRFVADINDFRDAISLRLNKIRRMTSDELLSEIQAAISGLNHPVKTPGIPMFMDAVLGGKDFFGGLKPRIGDRHIRVVSINGFPHNSFPGILDALNNQPFIYRWSTRFIALDPVDAIKAIGKFRLWWMQKQQGLAGLLKSTLRWGEGWINQDAVDMAKDANIGIAEVSAGKVRYGFYTTVVVIMDVSPESADQHAAQLIKALGNIGFVAQIETVNAIEAYLGSLPGHGYQNVRCPILHTENLSDLLPTTAIYSGPEHHPCPFYPEKSPPLLYSATTGHTPFRFCLHEGDVGHTMILGPTGSGKSALLGLIMAQHLRYQNARVFCFDRGNSAFILAQAAGGRHYEIGGEEPISFCPLAQIDTEQDIAWAKGYMEDLLALHIKVTPSHRLAVSQAIDRMAASSELAAHRTLSDFYTTVQDREIKEVLSYYIDSAAILNADEDALQESRFSVFETGNLMGMGDTIVVPVLLHLFHQIEKSLTGQPTLIILDEASSLLANPLFAKKLRDWLKTLRKSNAAVVFATQSLSDVANSELADVIYESTPTKFYLPNPEAATENFSLLYKKMGLNSRQIEIISTATPKRHYYVASPSGKRLINLGLGPATLAFVGASSKPDIAEVKSLIKTDPDWVKNWLKKRGVSEELLSEYTNYRVNLSHIDPSWTG